MVYDFGERLAAGEKAERVIDECFARWFDIAPVSMTDQRRGIDRQYMRRDNGCVYAIEYKTDWTAGRTGNAFVETVSVDTQNKPGWVYTTQADYVLYYVPGDELIYVLDVSIMRCHLRRWANQYRAVTVQNQGYCTKGVLVPLREFEEIAKQVVSI